jgi:hypothetical protein
MRLATRGEVARRYWIAQAARARQVLGEKSAFFSSSVCPAFTRLPDEKLISEVFYSNLCQCCVN